MTFGELLESLPNGLHDAELKRLELESAHRRLVLDLDVWITTSIEDPRLRELYRPARIVMNQATVLAVHPPDARVFDMRQSVQIDAGLGIPETVQMKAPDVPADRHIAWLYMEESGNWSGLVLLTVGESSIEWTGPEFSRG